MNVLFVPTLGLDVSLLDRLAASVDYPIRSKVAFNNGESGALDGFRDTHDDWIVKESAFGNLGVAGAWNQCAKMFPEEQSWLIANDDCYFLPGYLEKICKCADEYQTEPVVFLNNSNAFYCFVWTRRGKQDFGEFDENFWPAYCLSPETLVLNDNLRWVEIGSLQLGDGLVGVEEQLTSRFGRRYIQSNVVSIQRKIAQSLRIIFDDDREVICSTDHKWLSAHPSPRSLKKNHYCWEWVPADKLTTEWVCYAPLRTWKKASTFDEGWLCGMLDGEGSFRSAQKGLEFYQKSGGVLEIFKCLISSMGMRYSEHKDSDNNVAIQISTKRCAIELMGRLRPVRLFPQQRKLWENVHVRSRYVTNRLAIKHIEVVGEKEVVSIGTTSRTFIANGIISHNCEDCDMKVRHKLGGQHGYVYALQGLEPLPHGKLRTGGINYSAMIQGTGLLNREYWLRKWGSLDFEKSTYLTPYNDQRLTFRDTVWYPDDRAIRRRLWDSFMSLPNPSIYDEN